VNGTTRIVVAALVAMASIAACGGDDDAEEPAATTIVTTTTVPEASSDLATVDLALEPVVTLDRPIALATRPGTDDLYIAEKGGVVRRVEVTMPEADDPDGAPAYRLDPRPVIDLSEDIVDQGEQGLLGLAFSSDGRRLYLAYTARADGANTVEAVELGDATTAGADDRQVLLAVEDPAPNHNGGQLVLGPDGYLYIGLGDGGGAGDPQDTGQDSSDLLGSILRIDPEASTDTRPYAIPTSNPFTEAGEPTEVWAYGLRNPWRFTFDRATGDLWVGDVGQGDWEEIDRLPAAGGEAAGRGANLGWSAMEGSHPFNDDGNPDGAVLPIFEYGHGDGGCSVTGGYRYRGGAIPTLVGVYVFADYCLDTIEGIELDDSDSTVSGHRTWNLATSQVQSFGEDADGELYVLQAGGSVARIVAAP
jgi:glucose/arabinose dehydrogenase